jgi:hypothetical protein
LTNLIETYNDLEAQTGNPLADAEKVVESRSDKTKPYMDKFTKWCETHGHTPSVPLLIEWDNKWNVGKIQALFGTTEEQLAIARKTLYNRVFYAYFSQRIAIKPQTLSVGSKSYLPDAKIETVKMSTIQKGVDLKSMDAAARKHLIERTAADLRSMVNKFVALQLPLEKLQLLLTEAIDGVQ